MLVSADFLASDYSYDVEVRRAMERHEAGEARVIPVILRPALWKPAPFGKLQALPKDARPVNDWPNRDKAFLSIANGIYDAVKQLRTQRLMAERQDTRQMEANVVGFAYPTILMGSTPNYNVYYDPSLGDAGQECAAGVLATCERDFETLTGWFGGITLPTLPIIIIIAPLDPAGQGKGGAFYYGSGAVDLYCDIKTVPSVDINYTRMLVLSQAVHVFADAQGLGWDAEASNGEGLSLALTGALYPAEMQGYAAAAAWLDFPGRPDWVNNTNPTDSDPVSNGCAVLFLNYLHTQLGLAWDSIIQSGAPTLAQTYTNLTGRSDGWTLFREQLGNHFPPGVPSGLDGDNPYPLR